MGYVGKVKDTAGNTHLVGSTLYGTCSTAASTKAKVVTCANFTELVTGVTIHVKFSTNNTASGPTLNVNGTGAKTIGITDGDPAEKWDAGSIVSFTYDGEYWLMNDVNTGEDTKNTAGSTNSTSKLYLVGATSQAASPVTYSNSKVYATDGALVATSFNGVELNGNFGDSMHFVSQYSELVVPGDKAYTLGDACEKGVDTSISSGSTSTNLPTSAAVASYAGVLTNAEIDTILAS